MRLHEFLAQSSFRLLEPAPNVAIALAQGASGLFDRAVLLDGTRVDGPVALRRALVAQKEQFVRAVTAKLLTYALGRGIEYYDAPAIRGIVRSAAADNYRWSSVILGIVKSAPFQMRKTTEEVEKVSAR